MKIFISHFFEEAQIAFVLKKWIETTFPGNCEVFVSSDTKDMLLGEDWMHIIKKELDESKIILLICSPISIERPWINFEAGCGWIKKIPIIPICHSGLDVSSLPPPYSSRNAIELHDNKFPNKLFTTLAENLDIKHVPPIRFNDMKNELSDAQKIVEEKLRIIKGTEIYDVWDQNNNKLINALKEAHKDSTIRIIQTWFPDVEAFCDRLEKLLIRYEKEFRFEILLMDEGEPNPCNDIIDARVKHRKEDRTYARYHIIHTIKRLIKMKEEVDSEWKGIYEKKRLELKIRSYKFMPFGPIYQIGNKFIFAGFFINYASSVNAPMFIVQNPESEIWKIFEKNFEKGWKKAQIISIREFKKKYKEFFEDKK